jgi:hypothetical protein
VSKKHFWILAPRINEGRKTHRMSDFALKSAAYAVFRLKADAVKAAKGRNRVLISDGVERGYRWIVRKGVFA